MHLYIGNKNYSSWSLRPWLLMTALNIGFKETVIPLDQPDTKSQILEVSGAGQVPILVDGKTTVWESLAIMEYLAERFEEINIWPKDARARAHARSISAEMHAGFQPLRARCPMNLGKRFNAMARGRDVDANANRICELWSTARSTFASKDDGPFLYGSFGAADAMYAPIVTRLDTYAFPVGSAARIYMDAVLGHPAYQAWLTEALKEPWVLEHDEVDEQAAENLRPYVSQ